MNIEISIIIPVYNSEKGIDDTLNSIINQSYFKNESNKVEVIVVDNNSNDNTFKIAKSYQNEFIKVYKQTEIQGSYASRNYGASKASGNFFLFIDADITLSNSALNLIFFHLNRQQIHYAGLNVKMKLSSLSLSSRMNFLRGFDIENSIRKHHYTPTCALLISRKVFEDVKGFNNSLESGGDFIFGISAYNLKFKQLFLSDVELFHPTRNTYKSLIVKSNRVARGNVQLAISNPKKYLYLYKRHFYFSNFKPRNPMSYKKVFLSNNLPFSLFDFIISPFFHIPISFLRLIHAIGFYKKIKHETDN